MGSENGLVKRNQAKHPLNCIHLETDVSSVDFDWMILMTFSNLNDLMISTISAASVHPFWGESKLLVAILVFIQSFMSCFFQLK